MAQIIKSDKYYYLLINSKVFSRLIITIACYNSFLFTFFQHRHLIEKYIIRKN